MTCPVTNDLSRHLAEEEKHEARADYRESLQEEAEHNCLFDSDYAAEIFYDRLIGEGLEAELRSFMRGMTNTACSDRYAELACNLYKHITKSLEDGDDVEYEIDRLEQER